MEPTRPGVARLTDEQAQELVLSTVARHAESLLRVAYRHSLCADDAHDAYQRSMEILLRRAPTLDPRNAHKWLHVVVRHEALQVRKSRSAVVAPEEIDYERHVAMDVSSPEERALTADRATRANEAMQRLKPQEVRAIWLKAMGYSYDQISEITGFSATKVNRCLTEGRKSFLARFEGIEAGAECERWEPVLTAIVAGDATPAQMADVRPHLRNCQACRATLRGRQIASPQQVAAVLPFGLASVAAKVSGLLDRLLPGGGAEAAGGAGLAGASGLKLAGVVAAGAVAVGGGTVAVQHERARPEPAVASPSRVAAKPSTHLPRTVSLPSAPARTAARAPRIRHAVAPAKTRHAVAGRDRPAAHAAPELKPLGGEDSQPPPRAVSAAAHPTPSTPQRASGTDSSFGEFAPQP